MKERKNRKGWLKDKGYKKEGENAKKRKVKVCKK